jgi:ABC-2 type transport system ATP-binding protein
LYCDIPGELKKKFPGGVIAVRAPDPARLRDIFASTPSVRSVLLVGDRVHLFVDDAAKRLADIRSLLEAEAVVFDSVEQIAPSIEDLFVSAVEARATEAS